VREYYETLENQFVKLLQTIVNIMTMITGLLMWATCCH